MTPSPPDVAVTAICVTIGILAVITGVLLWLMAKDDGRRR
jgi:hypothetical protein